VSDPPCSPADRAPSEHAPSEHAIQNDILRHFGQRPGMRLWRANCGVAVMGMGPTARKVRFGIPGQADLSGVIQVVVLRVFRPRIKLGDEPCFGAPDRYPDDGPVIGLRLEIEVKSATGRQRPEQKAFQAMIQKYGGIYILARSVNDVHAALETLIDGYQR
jgi:hypothetical protein